MLKVPASLVNVAWLKENLLSPNLIILDASIKKVTGTDNQEPSNIGIVGSRYFDIQNNFSDLNDNFPNTFPSADQFQSESRKLGIDKDSAIVVYDDKGIYSSARAWYMFKAFGHDNVAVLDGGLPEWIRDDNTIVERKDYNGPIGNFVATYNPDAMIFFEEFKAKVDSDKVLVLDARSSGRYSGTEPEPRPGLRGGHIPRSLSLPHTALIDGYKMKSLSELQNIFNNFENNTKPLVFSCGSGITACVLALGADLLGKENFKVYDGSWTEWGTLVSE